MVCVNINDPEFKKILEKSKNPLLAEIEYMEKYGLIDAKPSQPTQIKEGVEELFNSNPELANQVYESLGFNTTKDIKETWINYISKKDNITRKEVLQRLDIYNPKMITVYRGEGSTVNLENSDLPDYIKKSKGRWFTKDKTVAEQYAEMQKGKLFAVQLPEELFNNISKALNLQDTNGMEALLPQELVDEKIEITTPTAQQKQEALKRYSEYLDSIFPESKVKEIVYRGSEKDDLKLFQYWTNNKSEAYIYAKGHFTKGGRLTERNPIPVIRNNFKNYIDYKYGENAFKSLNIDQSDFLVQVSETEYSFRPPNWYRKDIKLDSEDQSDFDSLKTLEQTHEAVKVTDDNEIDKPYTVDNYDALKSKYDLARKQLNKFFKRKEVGILKSAILNIKNPYADEIVQEDLRNDYDAYRNGHDGALLMDGDHFLVKSDTNQTHILGTQEDIEGFKSFVKGEIVSTSTQEVTLVPLSSKELLNEIEIDETKKEDQCELNLNYDDFDLPF
jgi:hypothetical protein